MTPQFARVGDEEALIALYRACFPEDPEDFWRWLLTRGPYRPGNTLVQRDGEVIAASLQMIPLELEIGGGACPAHYIYAAATLPQYRGAGRMASLLTQAAEEGRARGQQYSILIVQEPGLLRFYEKNGYRSQVVWNALSLSREGLRAGETLRPAEERDIPALGEIYEKAAQNAPHGARSRENWLDNLGIYEKNAVVLEKQGAVKAYCFADPAGASEAAGEDAARLAGLLLPENAPVSTPRPGGAVRLCGSIRPLTESARVRLGDEPVYLDLMYN